MSSILDYFPSILTPSELQTSYLTQVESLYPKYDAFMSSLPTASGKSACAKTLATWLWEKHGMKSAIITSTNILVKQFLKDFPDTPTLYKKSTYRCNTGTPKPCTEQWKKKNLGGPCKGCVYWGARREVQESPYCVLNTWMYKAINLAKEKDALIIDEAHLIIDLIRALEEKVIWQFKSGYPSEAHKWLPWLADNGYGTNLHPKEETRPYGQAKTPRKCLILRPLDISKSKPYFWPRSIKKIFLLSATISPKDLEILGLLGRKNCIEISATSPIMAEQRPLYTPYVGNMSARSQDANLDKLVNKIKELAAEHPNEKGLIHAPYSLAAKIKTRLKDHPRFMWHTREDKDKVYRTFRGTEDPKILVGSGLYEGIDLTYDSGRWQIITKVPYPYLGDPITKALADMDPQWYHWETIKVILQAYGRICRRPDDYGKTFVLDSMFEYLYNKNQDLFPGWFKLAKKD